MAYQEHYNDLSGKPLSVSQRDILILSARGLSAVQIAGFFSNAENTIKDQLDIAYKKLYSQDILEATLKGIQANEIRPCDVLTDVIETDEYYAQRLSLLPLTIFNIFEELGYGFKNYEIASRLSLSKSTVTNHLQELKDQIGIQSRTQIGLLSALLFEPESLLDDPEAQ